MGFKLPGQSIQVGTSAHKSALKKVAVAKAMAPSKAMAPNKAMESPNKESAYAKAKKKDPNLDKYIKERKKYDAGSKEYEELQAKINAAYGKKRDPKLKEAKG